MKRGRATARPGGIQSRAGSFRATAARSPVHGLEPQHQSLQVPHCSGSSAAPSGMKAYDDRMIRSRAPGPTPLGRPDSRALGESLFDQSEGRKP